MPFVTLLKEHFSGLKQVEAEAPRKVRWNKERNTENTQERIWREALNRQRPKHILRYSHGKQCGEINLSRFPTKFIFLYVGSFHHHETKG